MPLPASCPSCLKPLTVADAGQAKCPHCGAPLEGASAPPTQARRGSLAGGGERTPDEPVNRSTKRALLLTLIVGGAVLLLILGVCGLGAYLIQFGVQQ